MSVVLSSSDQEEFKVDKEVAQRSVLIKNMLEGTKRKQIRNGWNSQKKKKKKNRRWRSRCSYSSS